MVDQAERVLAIRNIVAEKVARVFTALMAAEVVRPQALQQLGLTAEMDLVREAQALQPQPEVETAG